MAQGCEATAEAAHRPEEGGNSVPQAETRVLHVITRLIRGGADENTLLTIRGMSSRYATDLAVGRDSELEDVALPPGVRVFVVPQLVREIRPHRDLAALAHLVRLMRAEDYALVHTHTAKAGVLGRVAAATSGTPVVVHTLHGSTFHPYVNPVARHVYLALERLAARWTDRFITVGDDLGQRYVDAGVMHSGDYDTIYSGMDVERFVGARTMSEFEQAQLRRELGVPLGVPLVGVFARLERRKGHVYLFEAMRALSERLPDLHLLVVGDGGYRRELQELAERLDITERLHWAGHRRDIQRTLAIVDVVALTSLWEGLPRTLVQAALVGRPIVTFAVEGAREIVHDGVNGYVVPIGDVGALTTRLGQVLESVRRGASMGGERVEELAELWSVDRMVDSTAALYDRLLDAA